MPTYEFELKIQATSIEAATRKANAGAVLLENLSTEEIEKLAYVVRNEPEKLALARKFLGLK